MKPLASALKWCSHGAYMALTWRSHGAHMTLNSSEQRLSMAMMKDELKAFAWGFGVKGRGANALPVQLPGTVMSVCMPEGRREFICFII